jgi:hypothetical protein
MSERLTTILKSLEWSGSDTHRTCPKCFRHCSTGHSEDCELKAALKAPVDMTPEALELAELKQAMALTSTVLPEIDKEKYAYSKFQRDIDWRFEQYWNGREWVEPMKGVSLQKEGILLRRLLKVRKTPVDQDAIEIPRRPCLVRNMESQDWIPAQLLSVDTTRQSSSKVFFVALSNGRTDGFTYCEIEVKNE